MATAQTTARASPRAETAKITKPLLPVQPGTSVDPHGILPKPSFRVSNLLRTSSVRRWDAAFHRMCLRSPVEPKACSIEPRIQYAIARCWLSSLPPVQEHCSLC